MLVLSLAAGWSDMVWLTVGGAWKGVTVCVTDEVENVFQHERT